MIQSFIDDHISKKLIITIGNENHNLHVIDWRNITEQHDLLMEQTEDMEDEEVGEFLLDNESELMQITENFMNDACDEKVEDEKWIPIGLLGLPHPPETYTVSTHQGLLLVDMNKKFDHPPVLLFKKGKAQIIADSLDELKIKTL